MARTLEEFYQEQIRQLDIILEGIKTAQGRDNIVGSMSIDVRSASREYENMRTHFIELATMAVDKRKNSPEYIHKVNLALDSARIYLNTHKGHRVFEKGKQRQYEANRIITLLSPFMENYERERKALVNSELTKLRQGNVKDKEVRKKIAKLQKSIGITNFIPKRPDFEVKPSKLRRFWGALKHGIYSCLQVVSHLTIGVAGAITNGLFTISHFKEKKINKELDSNLIPGGNGEKFEKLEPEKGPADQPIINDKRRVPVNFEVPIPGDTKAAPTMSVLFDEGVEGSTNGYALIRNKEGKLDLAMGHAFVSLEYTKKDPATGKEQRYRSTFGFYPHPEFLTLPMTIAMGTDGLHVPGILNDDHGHEFSTGKKYVINNQKVNQVMLAAQEYINGGYNYIARNCTTFAHDMAAAAGIKMDDIFVETDLQSNVANAGSFIGLFSGAIMSRFAEKQIADRGQDEALDYQRYGQKVVTKSDIKNLKKRQLNIRLKGYIPAYQAEATRNSKDFKLMSMKFENKGPIPKRLEDGPEWNIRVERINFELASLVSEINKLGTKRGVDLSEQSEALRLAVNASLGEIHELAVPAFSGQGVGENIGKPVSLPEQKLLLEEGTKKIDDIISNLQDFYDVTFKSDKDLNIPFQHLVSNLQFLKKNFENKYARFVLDRSVVPMKTDQQIRHLREYREMLGDKSELGLFKAGFFGVNKKFQKDNINYVFTNPQLLAASKIFGNLEQYFQDNSTANDLNIKSKDSKLSEEEKKFMKNFEAKLELVEMNSRTLGDFFERDLTDDEIKIAFIEAPEVEDSFKNVTFKQSSLSNNLQAVVFHKAFGDIKPRFVERMTKIRQNLKKAFEENIKKSIMYPSAREKALKLMVASKDMICKMVSQEYVKMFKDNPEFDKVIDMFTERTLTSAGEPLRSDPEYKNYAKACSLKSFTEKISNDYMIPLLLDLNEDLKGGAEYSDDIEMIIKDSIVESINGVDALTNANAKDYRAFLAEKYKENLNDLQFGTQEDYEKSTESLNEALIRDKVNSVRKSKVATDIDELKDLRTSVYENLKYVASQPQPDDNTKLEIKTYLATVFEMVAVKEYYDTVEKACIEAPLSASIASQRDVLIQNAALNEVFEKYSAPEKLNQLINEYNPDSAKITPTEHAILVDLKTAIKKKTEIVNFFDKDDMKFEPIHRHENNLEEKKPEEIKPVEIVNPVRSSLV